MKIVVRHGKCLPEVRFTEPEREHQTNLNDGSTFRSAITHESVQPFIETVQNGIVNNDADKNKDKINTLINDIIASFTLNNEQSNAFRIIARQTLMDKNDQLRMLLIGPGGTGKSRVIQAVQEFFTRSNQAKRLRLASYGSSRTKH